MRLGEHWLGTQAFELRLVDVIKTSDDYLLANSATANLYEICYETKKSFMSKFAGSANALLRKDDLFFGVIEIVFLAGAYEEDNSVISFIFFGSCCLG